MTDVVMALMDYEMKKAQKERDEAVKAMTEAQDKNVRLRGALLYYTNNQAMMGGQLVDDGMVAREALDEHPQDETYYTRLELAENENAAFHILVRPLLAELKLCGWGEDYATYMLGEMVKSKARVDSKDPTVADMFAINTMYASKLEDLCRDIAKIADPSGVNQANLDMTILAAYESSYKYVMDQHKDPTPLEKMVEEEPKEED
jgi:hypothetical protein